MEGRELGSLDPDLPPSLTGPELRVVEGRTTLRQANEVGSQKKGVLHTATVTLVCKTSYLTNLNDSSLRNRTEEKHAYPFDYR